MVTIPLPDAQLMTFAEFIDWKLDNRHYELHSGTPIEMQPTGNHEESIACFNSALLIEIHRQNYPLASFAAMTRCDRASFPT